MPRTAASSHGELHEAARQQPQAQPAHAPAPTASAAARHAQRPAQHGQHTGQFPSAAASAPQPSNSCSHSGRFAGQAVMGPCAAAAAAAKQVPVWANVPPSSSGAVPHQQPGATAGVRGFSMLDELPGMAPRRAGQPGSGGGVGDLAEADDPWSSLEDQPPSADEEQWDHHDLEACLIADVLQS